MCEFALEGQGTISSDIEKEAIDYSEASARMKIAFEFRVYKFLINSSC